MKKRRVFLFDINKGAFELTNPSDDHIKSLSDKYTVLIDPNTSQMLGVPRYYWAIKDGKISEMSEEEKSLVKIDLISWVDVIHPSQSIPSVYEPFKDELKDINSRVDHTLECIFQLNKSLVEILDDYSSYKESKSHRFNAISRDIKTLFDKSRKHEIVFKVVTGIIALGGVLIALFK